MVDTLETLIAKQAITEVLHRYCYAMDRNDLELGRQVWHPDGLAHYGEIYDGPAEGYLQQTTELHKLAAGTSHQLANAVITVDGDRATSESYIHGCIRIGDGRDLIVRGRYLDTWSCRDGEWRIDERTYENDLTQVIAAEDSLGF